MKRDMDLCRAIMSKLADEGGIDINAPMDEYPAIQVRQHMHLLWQAGLVDADEITAGGYGQPPEAWAYNLSWAGHDFLSVARNETLWAKAKEVAMKSIGGLTLEVLKTVLGELSLKLVKREICD